MPPQENSLMELGNTFWLWGVLIVQRSVERNLEFHVSKKKIAQNLRWRQPISISSFEESFFELFCCLPLSHFGFQKKGSYYNQNP